MGRENAEGMAHVGVRVEPPVRLWSEGTALLQHKNQVLALVGSIDFLNKSTTARRAGSYAVEYFSVSEPRRGYPNFCVRSG